jgi:hypothetical protein
VRSTSYIATFWKGIATVSTICHCQVVDGPGRQIAVVGRLLEETLGFALAVLLGALDAGREVALGDGPGPCEWGPLGLGCGCRLAAEKLRVTAADATPPETNASRATTRIAHRQRRWCRTVIEPPVLGCIATPSIPGPNRELRQSRALDK